MSQLKLRFLQKLQHKIEVIKFLWDLYEIFGINEWQRNILGYLDKNIINYLIPKEWNYIFFGVFKKSK